MFPRKTCLIVKSQHLRKARVLFRRTGVIINDAGRCHLHRSSFGHWWLCEKVCSGQSVFVGGRDGEMKLLSPSHMNICSIYTCISPLLVIYCSDCIYVCRVFLSTWWCLDPLFLTCSDWSTSIWSNQTRASFSACLPWGAWHHCFNYSLFFPPFQILVILWLL